jgi:hypothetical protein
MCVRVVVLHLDTEHLVPLRESLGEADESRDTILNNWSNSSSYLPNTDPFTGL